jgi:hypothetical protein
MNVIPGVTRAAIAMGADVASGAVVPLAERLFRSASGAVKPAQKDLMSWKDTKYEDMDESMRKEWRTEVAFEFAKFSFVTTVVFPIDDDVEEEIFDEYL